MKYKYDGFSSLEMGISIFLIVVISAILVFSFNPSKEISLKRNKQRNDDVAKILNAFSQYVNDSSNNIPNTVPVLDDCLDERAEICKTGAADCTGLVEVKIFADSGVYLPSVPVDPSSKSVNGTGYNIIQNRSGVITVCAPLSEGEGISISK